MFCEDQTKVRAPAYLQVRQLDLQVFQQLQSDLTTIRTSDQVNPLRDYRKWYNLWYQWSSGFIGAAAAAATTATATNNNNNNNNNNLNGILHSVPRALWDQQTSSLFTHQIPSSSSPSQSIFSFTVLRLKGRRQNPADLWSFSTTHLPAPVPLPGKANHA